MSEEIKIEAAKMFDVLNKVEVEVLEDGKLPVKANKSDAGFDVFATEDVVIYPGEIVKHPLNIKLKLPVGTWARIETKSGLGSKGMLVYAGVIDRGYRGVPHVVCTNMRMKKKEQRTVANIINPNLPGTETEEVIVDNDEPIVIRKGEKIAQITMNPHCEEFYMVQVDAVNDDTDRGAGGFGSTGK